MKRLSTLLVICALLLAFSANAQQLEFLRIWVVDAGFGHCCIITLPDGRIVVYDAGSLDGGREHIRDVMAYLNPDQRPVEFLVISHQHKDHYNAVSEAFGENGIPVKRIVRTNYFQPSEYDRPEDDYYHNFNEWLLEAECIPNWPSVIDTFLTEYDGRMILSEIPNQPYISDIPAEYQYYPFGHGDLLPVIPGEAAFTLLAGWDNIQWDTYDMNPNETSIVLRLDYAGRSVLFTGDSTGRIKGSNDFYEIWFAEAYMRWNHDSGYPQFSLDADVLIAPHHGSDGSCSYPFVEAVSPVYTIFPAGKQHNHPTVGAATRTLTAMSIGGLDEHQIFRTDLGDHEQHHIYTDPDLCMLNEWDYGRIWQNTDEPGDDDVEIWIYSNGALHVNWANPYVHLSPQ